MKSLVVGLTLLCDMADMAPVALTRIRDYAPPVKIIGAWMGCVIDNYTEITLDGVLVPIDQVPRTASVKDIKITGKRVTKLAFTRTPL